jgi:hypothetical protein
MVEGRKRLKNAPIRWLAQRLGKGRWIASAARRSLHLAVLTTVFRIISA